MKKKKVASLGHLNNNKKIQCLEKGKYHMTSFICRV